MGLSFAGSWRTPPSLSPHTRPTSFTYTPCWPLDIRVCCFFFFKSVYTCQVFVAACGIFNCSTQTQLTHVESFPDRGSNLGPPLWERGASATGPPGKSRNLGDNCHLSLCSSPCHHVPSRLRPPEGRLCEFGPRGLPFLLQGLAHSRLTGPGIW